MTLNNNFKKGIITLLTLGCFWGGYQYYNQTQNLEKYETIETQKVKKTNLKSIVSATGIIKPVNSVEISSKITARIKDVLVKENEFVKAGQTVALLDGKDFQAKYEQAQAKVLNTKAKYDRAAYLYEIGANTKEQFEDAIYNYDTAVTNLEVTQSDLAETVIIAPMDGVIVGEPKTPGTMAVQGVSNPTIIMRIADLSSKQIKAQIDETDIGKIKIGQEATFTVDAYTDKKFKAIVEMISQTDVTNSWDTSSTTTSSAVIYYYVTLRVEDPEEVLLPAMTARLEITTSSKDNAVAIPISALKTNTNGTYVIVINPNGTSEERLVKTGIYSEDYVEILDGLKIGEEVSTSYSIPKITDNAINTKGKKANLGPRLPRI